MKVRPPQAWQAGTAGEVSGSPSCHACGGLRASNRQKEPSPRILAGAANLNWLRGSNFSGVFSVGEG